MTGGGSVALLCGLQVAPGDSGQVGPSLQGRRADDGLLIPGRSGTTAMRPEVRAAHREAALLPPLGTTPDHHHLGVRRSTADRVLARYGMPLLTHIDQATGLARAQAQIGSLRCLGSRGTRARRHQEARPDSRGGKLADVRVWLGSTRDASTAAWVRRSTPSLDRMLET